MDMVTPQGFAVAPHIFPRYVDGHFLILDLRRDTYMQLDQSDAEALRYLLHSHAKNAPAPADIETRIKTLAEQGILTKERIDSATRLSQFPDQATLDLKGWPHDGLPKIRAGHVITLFRAFLRARFMRRFYSMERIVLAIADRKQRNLTEPGYSQASLDRVRELVEIHRILRVLFYTAKNHCLFDSLTLVEFLAHYGVYPSWVFGVRMGPFAAHCWVQDGEFVYNDAVDHVSSFDPIMSV